MDFSRLFIIIITYQKNRANAFPLGPSAPACPPSKMPRKHKRGLRDDSPVNIPTLDGLYDPPPPLLSFIEPSNATKVIFINRNNILTF
eukprot:gene12555-8604_t